LRGLRIGIAGGIDRATAEQRFFHLAIEIEGLQDAQRFGHDFRANPVAGEKTNLHAHPSGEQPGLLEPALFFKGPDLLGVPQGQADVVPAVEQAFLAEAIDGKRQSAAVGTEHLLLLEIDQQPAAGRRLDECKQGVDLGRRQTIGRMPFLKQLLKKMSAKLSAITARKPKSSKAQGACSRELPQPKFLRVSRICAP
jgi:hypothetical protein